MNQNYPTSFHFDFLSNTTIFSQDISFKQYNGRYDFFGNTLNKTENGTGALVKLILVHQPYYP
jgi:hypothetical protein